MPFGLARKVQIVKDSSALIITLPFHGPTVCRWTRCGRCDGPAARLQHLWRYGRRPVRQLQSTVVQYLESGRKRAKCDPIVIVRISRLPKRPCCEVTSAQLGGRKDEEEGDRVALAGLFQRTAHAQGKCPQSQIIFQALLADA